MCQHRVQNAALMSASEDQANYGTNASKTTIIRAALAEAALSAKLSFLTLASPIGVVVPTGCIDESVYLLRRLLGSLQSHLQGIIY